MPTDRAIDETIARCVSSMVRYHNTERSTDATDTMLQDIRAIAAQFISWELAWDEWDMVRQCVRGELLTRYGHEAGTRICAEFADAFESVFVTPGSLAG